MVYNVLDDEYEVMIQKQCMEPDCYEYDEDGEEEWAGFDDLPSAEKACNDDAECIAVQQGDSGMYDDNESFYKCSNGYSNHAKGIVFSKKGTLLITI